MTLRAGVLVAVLLGTMVSCAGCLRAPIGDDLLEGGDLGSSSGPSAEDATGPGASSASDASESSDASDDSADPSGEPEAPPPSCHPSYEPCLPIVDDLNCPDVRALDAAPVTVIGPDEYELDRDDDGIGCET